LYNHHISLYTVFFLIDNTQNKEILVIQHHPKGSCDLGRPKQRWKDHDYIQDQVLTSLNILKPFHDDEDDDDYVYYYYDTGMWGIFLLGKAHY
jgi:hypothetical protein